MLLNIVEKDRRRREEIHQRALVSEFAIKSSRYIRGLQAENARVHQTNRDLEHQLASLQRLLASRFFEALKEQSVKSLARFLVEHYKEHALKIFDLNAVEEMSKIADQCLSKHGLPASMDAVRCFEHVLDLADLVIESRRYSPLSPVVSELKYEAVMYWKRGHEFRVGIELPQEGFNDIKKVQDAYQGK